jgi:phosphonate transport system ATP-binding protein
MQDAEIILADEPISALDPELAEDALELLVGCVARRGVTLVVNLHQPELARRFASRLIGLADGRVVFDAPPGKFAAADSATVYRGGGPGRSPTKGGPDERAAARLAQKAGHPDLRLVGD